MFNSPNSKIQRGRKYLDARSGASLFLASGGFLNFNNSDVTITHSSNLLAFAGAATGYTFDALVDLSSAAAGNIKFPATQNASANANTLDDYAEGTFTPGFSFGGAAVGITYSTQLGAYTKIGRMVFGHGQVILSAKGSSTGAARITGLPFTSGSAPNATAGVSIGFYSSMATSTGLMGRVTPAATTCDLYIGGAATSATAADTNFTASSRIDFSFYYMV